MENSQALKRQRMTEAPIEPLILKLALPTILSMLVSSFYNMADTFFVGRIGTSASAAVGVVFSLMTFIQAVGFFFGHGTGNYMSRALGSEDYESAEKMASTGFFSALITGVVIMLGGIAFIKPLARMLGSTETILPYAVEYLRVILIGAPFMTASLVLNNQLRFQGNAFYAMIGIVSGAVINIGLDPLFIFVFDMGIAGAAWATILSQFVSFLLLLAGTNRGDSMKIRFRNFKPGWDLYKIIINGGTPSLFRQGLGSVATICLNLAAGVYGDAAIAGMSIVSRIMMFANSCLIGFGQGFQPVCGFNYGAKKYDRVKEAFRFCVVSGTVFLTALAVIGFTFAPQIIELFRKGDPEVIAVGAKAMRMQCLTFPLLAWIVMCNMMSQTIGMMVPATFLAVARQGLFFIPLVLILPHFFGLLGVQLSQTLADAVSFIFSIPIQIRILKSMKDE